jgi:hypothetical protein
MSEKRKRFTRRTTALFWVAAVGVVIGILIYFELISILYVLATLALVLLLIIVGFSDLEGVGREHIDDFATRN